MKIFAKIWFWLKAARVHTLPTSFLSWLTAFLLAAKKGGNLYFGLLALIGVTLAHLGVNLIDDYFDYKRDVTTIKETSEKTCGKMQKGKCAYLKSGNATINQVLFVALGNFAIALLIGFYLMLNCGWQVLIVAFLAGILCISYPFLTYCGMSEFAVGVNYSPLLFAGVSFVMLGYFSKILLLVSISTGLLTVCLLHTHALMDFDCDIKDNKKTLCTILGSKNKSLFVLGVMMLLAYANILIGVSFKLYPISYLLPLLTIPLSIELYRLMKIGIEKPQEVPARKFWLGPMENWSDIVANNAQSFMLKFYLSRNIMMLFTLLLCVGILLG